MTAFPFLISVMGIYAGGGRTCLQLLQQPSLKRQMDHPLFLHLAHMTVYVSNISPCTPLHDINPVLTNNILSDILPCGADLPFSTGDSSSSGADDAAFCRLWMPHNRHLAHWATLEPPAIQERFNGCHLLAEHGYCGTSSAYDRALI